jgi:hypothetical protein
MAALLLLGSSATALACAALVLPESYSWIAHTTSQGAGQGVLGAWLPRIGFATFGTGVLWISANAHDHWRSLGRLSHNAFGALMIAAAIFSSRQWEMTASFDPIEDLLHSVAASSMGLAFAVGVVAVAVSRYWLRDERTVRLLDVVAIAASVLIPLSMMRYEAISGLLQRIMFTIAYIWYTREGLLISEAAAPAA